MNCVSVFYSVRERDREWESSNETQRERNTQTHKHTNPYRTHFVYRTHVDKIAEAIRSHLLVSHSLAFVYV